MDSNLRTHLQNASAEEEKTDVAPTRLTRRIGERNARFKNYAVYDTSVDTSFEERSQLLRGVPCCSPQRLTHLPCGHVRAVEEENHEQPNIAIHGLA